MRVSPAARGTAAAACDATGFTLVETLVALAVLATVLASAFGVFSTGLRGLSRSDERLTLAMFAESLLDRSGLDIVRAEPDASGSTADGLRWRVTRTPFEMPRAEVEAAAAAAGPPPPPGAEDAFAPEEREGRGQGEEGSRRLGLGGDSGAQEPGIGTGSRTGEAADEEETTRPGAPPRPSVRLWRVNVVVEDARGGSFTLTTLHVDRVPSSAGSTSSPTASSPLSPSR